MCLYLVFVVVWIIELGYLGLGSILIVYDFIKYYEQGC